MAVCGVCALSQRSPLAKASLRKSRKPIRRNPDPRSPWKDVLRIRVVYRTRSKACCVPSPSAPWASARGMLTLTWRTVRRQAAGPSGSSWTRSVIYEQSQVAVLVDSLRKDSINKRLARGWPRKTSASSMCASATCRCTTRISMATIRPDVAISSSRSRPPMRCCSSPHPRSTTARFRVC